MDSVQVENPPLASDEYFWRERCQHHWVIDQPNGPTSWGECKHCGDRREFLNNPDAVVRQPG